MKKNIFTYVVVLILLTINAAWAQKGLVVLPFSGLGITAVDQQTAESLLRMELTRLNVYALVAESDTREALDGGECAELPCAIALGGQLEVDRVLLCKLSGLGEKVIVQYTLLNVTSSEIVLLDNVSAEYVEDLDAVMKRVAMSVSESVPLSKTARVDNIIETETITPRRRSLRRYTSYTFGYLYPQNGYDDDSRSFVFDLRFGAELNQSEIGLQMGIHKGFAISVFSSYLLSKDDVCPYIGGAIGFHWVSHVNQGSYVLRGDGLDYLEELREDGIELTGYVGVRLLRTYDFQFLANLGYALTFNDYDDRAILFTIGILR